MTLVLPTVEVAAPTREDARRRAAELRPGSRVVRVRGLGNRWWVVSYRPRGRRVCPCGQKHARRRR